ncbi:MAG: type II toxin-antitoxin system HicA family toxin [Deltaproteobacteria bacterium]|nr:type II toxin-antitoxin system HicA family toxin [Deltaproteobacteria bacterium]
MSGKYPPLDRKQVENILKALGFIEKSHKSTSHAQWEGYIKGQRRVVTVDHLSRKKEKYGKRLLGKMIQQSGLTKKEFYKYL